MTKQEALRIANRLGELRPDRGNRYAPRTARVKGAAAFAQWQETCRALAYLLCIDLKVVVEADFYEVCKCEK
jgi:hypothetical protein